MKKIDAQNVMLEDGDQAIQRAIESLKKDAYIQSVIQSLSLTEQEIEQHLSTLLTMQENHQEIAQCEYQKSCIKPAGHYEVALKRNAVGFLERYMRPCPMLVSQLNVNQSLLYADFPDTWKDGNLFSEVSQRHHRKELGQTLARYLIDFPQYRRQNAFIYGPSRTGKSFSLATFAYKFALNEIGTIGMIDVAKRANDWLTMKQEEPEAFAREWTRLIKLDVLILDRLGDETNLDKTRDFLWLPLLQERLHDQKATLIISSFSLEDLLVLYAVFPSQKPKAKQLISLLESFENHHYLAPATPL